jgi:hypothetical protein
MTNIYNPVDTLNDAQVRNYFIGILESGLSSEEKYQRFVSYFEKEQAIWEQLESRLGGSRDGDQSPELADEDWEQMLDDIGAKMGAWHPEQLLGDMKDSILRAVLRLSRSQHHDGGWGPRIEDSNLWGTANAVMCLLAVRRAGLESQQVDTGTALQRGIAWLRHKKHRDEWWVGRLRGTDTMSVLCVSMAVLCFVEAAAQKVIDALPEVPVCIEGLLESQNRDGGWDASLWGPDIKTEIRKWSEIPATCFAVQALAASGEERVRQAIFRAADWCLRWQKPDGSWSRMPGDHLATIPSTCAALQGLTAAVRLGKTSDTMTDAVDKAISWLDIQEKPILDEERKIIGWGYGYGVFDFENACLTLETLVNVQQPCLPLLAANANLLMSLQTKDSTTVENGNWPKGDTARIARALVGFHSRLLHLRSRG